MRNVNQRKKKTRRIFAAATAVLLMISATACSKGGSSSSSASSKAKTTSSAASQASSKAASSSKGTPPAKTLSKANPSAAPLILPTKTSDGKVLLNVKNVQQTDKLRSGCEITAGTIALNYLGVKASKEDLLKVLPQSNQFTTKSGKLYGPNPWHAFVGNPLTEKYGCYAPVLSYTINKYLAAAGGEKAKHHASELTGAPVEALYANIDSGTPVVVWVTTDMKEPGLGDGWYLEDTGAYYQWITGEHCMVLVGYDKQNAIFCDPLNSNNTVSYNKDVFAERYRNLFSQAVGVK